MRILLSCEDPDERLSPLMRPIPLMRFLGKTLLEHQMERCMGSGKREFMVLASLLEMEDVADACGRLKRFDIKLALHGEQIEPAEKMATLWDTVIYPWDLFGIMERLLEGIQPDVSSTASVHRTATIEGAVLLDEGVQVLENAVIKGPCYVGKGTVIGTNTLVREGSNIGDGCVIGFGTEVKHSYIGDGCELHKSYVGDSIIDDGCSLGANTITANVRFDGRNVRTRVAGKSVDTGLGKLGVIMGTGCRTGAGAVMMPGVRLGADSIVGPNVTLDRDLPLDSAAYFTAWYYVSERHTDSEP